MNKKLQSDHYIPCVIQEGFGSIPRSRKTEIQYYDKISKKERPSIAENVGSQRQLADAEADTALHHAVESNFPRLRQTVRELARGEIDTKLNAKAFIMEVAKLAISLKLRSPFYLNFYKDAIVEVILKAKAGTAKEMLRSCNIDEDKINQLNLALEQLATNLDAQQIRDLVDAEVSNIGKDHVSSLIQNYLFYLAKELSRIRTITILHHDGNNEGFIISDATPYACPVIRNGALIAVNTLPIDHGHALLLDDHPRPDNTTDIKLRKIFITGAEVEGSNRVHAMFAKKLLVGRIRADRQPWLRGLESRPDNRARVDMSRARMVYER